MSDRTTADMVADLRVIADGLAVNIDLMNAAAFYRSIADRLAELDAEVERLRQAQAFTHAADCLSRTPDFDARDCNCRSVRL